MSRPSPMRLMRYCQNMTVRVVVPTTQFVNRIVPLQVSSAAQKHKNFDRVKYSFSSVGSVVTGYLNIHSAVNSTIMVTIEVARLDHEERAELRVMRAEERELRQGEGKSNFVSRLWSWGASKPQEPLRLPLSSHQQPKGLLLWHLNEVDEELKTRQ